MRIAVIDGQGGGVGRALITELSGKLPEGNSLIALGTNAIATSAMMKAGASEGATGENAIVYNAPLADVIAGPVGIIIANAMLGELSPAMAAAVSGSRAKKVLIPMEQCQVYIAGCRTTGMQSLIQNAVEYILRLTE